MTAILLCLAALLLAWSNGANDNQKGVATLRGSGALSARAALVLATLATAAGSLASIALSGGLVRSFRGAGLLPDASLGDPALLAAVGSAAALTIVAATRLGMPTSTTHALLGALLGAALVVAPAGIDGGALVARFVQPLALSPLCAIALAAPAAWAARRIGERRARGRARHGSAGESASASCVCVGATPVLAAPGLLAVGPALPVLSSGTVAECARRPAVARLRVPSAIDLAHLASGATVCFARALNDTPKIAALLVGAELLGASAPSVAVALAMGLGGVLHSEGVARTMSERITPMRPAEGALANLSTGALVLGASALALPVSTTHVSCGALFGLGVASGEARWGTIARILLAWVSTLPAAASLSAGLVLAARALG